MDEQEKKSIFRKESLDRISSPDQLDTYLHVTSISVYLLLAAIIVLLAAFFVWNASATLPSTVTCSAIADNGTLTCYLDRDSAAALKPGTECTVGENGSGTVIEVASRPLSFVEAAAQYDDYSVYMLGLGEWNYQVTISAPGTPDGFASVTMVTGVIRPIDFFIN